MILILDQSPGKAAKCYADRDISRGVNDVIEVLENVYLRRLRRDYDDSSPFVSWCGLTYRNFMWLYWLGWFLGIEYFVLKDKDHKNSLKLDSIRTEYEKLSKGMKRPLPLSSWPQSPLPAKFRMPLSESDLHPASKGDAHPAVFAYRNYYQTFPDREWRRREKPLWWDSASSEDPDDFTETIMAVV